MGAAFFTDMAPWGIAPAPAPVVALVGARSGVGYVTDRPLAGDTHEVIGGGDVAKIQACASHADVVQALGAERVPRILAATQVRFTAGLDDREAQMELLLRHLETIESPLVAAAWTACTPAQELQHTIGSAKRHIPPEATVCIAVGRSVAHVCELKHGAPDGPAIARHMAFALERGHDETKADHCERLLRIGHIAGALVRSTGKAPLLIGSLSLVEHGPHTRPFMPVPLLTLAKNAPESLGATGMPAITILSALVDHLSFE